MKYIKSCTKVIERCSVCSKYRSMMHNIFNSDTLDHYCVCSGEFPIDKYYLGLALCPNFKWDGSFDSYVFV